MTLNLKEADEIDPEDLEAAADYYDRWLSQKLDRDDDPDA